MLGHSGDLLPASAGTLATRPSVSGEASQLYRHLDAAEYSADQLFRGIRPRRWCADAGRPTRFKPSSPLPTDAVRDGSAKLGHPLQNVPREHGLRRSDGCPVTLMWSWRSQLRGDVAGIVGPPAPAAAKTKTNRKRKRKRKAKVQPKAKPKPKARAHQWTAAEKAAIGKRMKAYWAKRRKTRRASR